MRSVALANRLASGRKKNNAEEEAGRLKGRYRLNCSPNQGKHNLWFIFISLYSLGHFLWQHTAHISARPAICLSFHHMFIRDWIPLCLDQKQCFFQGLVKCRKGGNVFVMS